MQTFLPVPDFRASAQLLDRKRLGKQRVETIQVVRGLVVEGYGWRRHPAVLMWRDHLEALARYGLDVCAVWTEAGFADSCADTIRSDVDSVGLEHVRTQHDLAAAGALPPWLGRDDVHRSHRSSLLRKDPEHYGPLFRGDLEVPSDLPYVWPVAQSAAG